MNKTRLYVYSKKLFSYFNNNFERFYKNIPSSLCCLLIGFFTGGNLAPVANVLPFQGSTVNQFSLGLIVVSLIEITNYILIYFSKYSKKKSYYNIHIGNFKQGVLLGIFVDAFKVGS
jgi:hypothetical protein